MTATAAAQQSGDARRPIFAERFKTQTCKNFEQKGECPYEWRCMFAHGEHELRTKEMNIADDLVTEEAIKAFQKAREIAAKAARRKSRRDEARSRRRREAAGGCEPAAPAPAPAVAAGGNAVGQAILAQLQRGAAASAASTAAPPAPEPSACGPLGVPAMLEDDEQHEADPKAEAIVSPSSRQRRDPYASAYVPDEVSGGAASTSAVAGAAPAASSDDDHAPQPGASNDDTSGSGDSPSAVNAGSPPAATVIGTTKYRATVPACPVPPTPASGAFQALTSAEYGMAESGSNIAVSPEASFEAVTCAASWQMMQWQAAFVAQFQQQLLAQQQQQQNQYGGGSSNNQADLSAQLASAAAAASCMINPWLMNPQAAAAASAAAATGAPNLSPQPEPRAPQQQHQRRGRAGRVSH